MSQGGINREMGLFNTYLVLFLVMGLTITEMALAQLPEAVGQQIQPALTLALALTSLVLLLFYLYLRNDGAIGGQKKEDTHDKPFETQLLATEAALDHLFAHHTIPMAKSTLELGRIIDANPSFCKLLGDHNKEFIGKTWGELGVMPTNESHNKYLLEQGWIESIPDCKSDSLANLRVLSLLIHSKQAKEKWQVLTILSSPINEQS